MNETTDHILRSNANYSNEMLDKIFNGAEKKKVIRKFAKKYFKANANFGTMIFAQTLLVNYYKGQYKNQDEMIGDIQMMLCESHDTIRKTLNLDVNKYTIEQLMLECEATREKNCEQ